ncbi:hypothetical protein I4U23_005421 [Adineta vaga]|nr:hypothetical protein I4U23_005421 [Adineta vaga]
MVQSKLLDLPNELFLDIFQYFDVNLLYYSLYGLTIRLNNLLNKWHSKHLTLHTVEIFEFVRRYIDFGQIRSLSISHSNQMILLEELFTMPHFFRNCQALFVYDLIPLDFIDLVPRLSHFKSLKSLTVIRKVEISYQPVYNNLFTMIIRKRIPALKYLKLVVPRRAQFIPRFLSSSMLNSASDNLDHLTLNCSTISELFSLFGFLHNLDSISIDCLFTGRRDCSLTKTKITHLKIKMGRSSDVTLNDLTVLLTNTPQLKTFSLQAFGRDYADGNKWEHIIENNIPLLTKFRFEFRIFGVIDIDEIMLTYQTNFWSTIKQWFVKYDHKESETIPTRIYTMF